MNMYIACIIFTIIAAGGVAWCWNWWAVVRWEHWLCCALFFTVWAWAPWLLFAVVWFWRFSLAVIAPDGLPMVEVG